MVFKYVNEAADVLGPGAADEVEFVCRAPRCCSSFGRYFVLQHRSGEGPWIAEVPPPGARLSAILHRSLELEENILDPNAPGRAASANHADASLGLRGPRTGHRRFEVVKGRDGLDAARFSCRCGRQPIIGPRELAKVLLWAGADGKVSI